MNRIASSVMNHPLGIAGDSLGDVKFLLAVSGHKSGRSFYIRTSKAISTEKAAPFHPFRPESFSKGQALIVAMNQQILKVPSICHLGCRGNVLIQYRV